MNSFGQAVVERWVTLARLLRPQGRRGEVLADLLTDFPETLVGRQHLFLAPALSEAMDAMWRPCAVLSSWLPKGRNEGRVVLGIAGVEDIAGAERLGGLELRTPGQQRKTLSPEEAYIDDLIGCELLDRGVPIGSVADVHFPTSADGRHRLEDAPVLLIIRGESGESMIPFVHEHIDSVDLAARQIRMRLPFGLLEVQHQKADPASEPTR